MVRDRLLELQSTNNNKSQKKEKNSPDAKRTEISEFLSQISAIRDRLQDIDSSVEKLILVRRDIQASPSNDILLQKEADSLVNSINENASHIRRELNSLAMENDGEHLLENMNVNERIRKHQISTISHQFTTTMLNFNGLQTRYMDYCKDLIKVKCEISGQAISDQKLQDYLESDNPKVFTQSFMAETEAAKQSLYQIEARHQEILKIERSLIELGDLFKEMSQLVYEQGSTVDNIEKAIYGAKEYSKQANDNLIEAKKHKRRARRTKLICMVVLVVVAIVLILLLLWSFGAF